MVAADREQRIRELAHELWERGGGGDGEHDRHWLEAERRVDEEGRMSASAPPPAGPQEKATAKAGVQAAKKAASTPATGNAGGRRRGAAGNGASAR